jgi:sigma-B regulation protein RsbU (phosphoserine phosphatase)
MNLQPEPNAPMAVAIEANAEPERILLVDDDPTNLHVLYETLNGRGYRLLVAKNGEQALAVAAKAHPALILLDIMMPGIDGFETCVRLKEQPETADAAVIFLSALAETKDKVKGLGLGAVDYISKPFDADEVIARVETHLKIRRLERSLARKNRELEEVNQRMRLDLEAAARVQRSFLPDVLPASNVARFAWVYRPCEHLGGDSLSIFAFNEQYIGLYVVDVCGHGVPSSLLAVTIARSLSLDGGHASLLVEPSNPGEGPHIISPAQVAKQLNKLYPMDTQAHLYFTLLYGILDTSTGQFRFVSAGMPGPSVARADGTVEVHEVPGTPIGLLPDSEYEDSELALGPGDRLYLHSDGLSEERGEAGQMFGQEQMTAVIAEHRTAQLHASMDALIEAVVSWRGSEHLHDDVAIVAVEMLGGNPRGGLNSDAR